MRQSTGYRSVAGIRACVRTYGNYLCDLIYVWSYKGVSLKHSVLGLLDLSPMTGYDLKKTFDESVAHFWSADQAQIYRTLSGLVEAGLARVELVAQDTRPSRKVHHITDEGRAELDRWLRAPAAPVVVRGEFLAKVFFAGRLPDDEVRQLLEERRVTAETSRETLTELAEQEGAASTRDERLRLATLHNGLAHIGAELAWLDALSEELG